MNNESIKTVNTAGGASALASGFVRGVMIAAAFTIVSFGLCACILAYTKASEGLIPALATTVHALGALIAGYSVAKQKGSHGFLSGTIAGTGYMLILQVIAMLAGDGFYFGIRTIAMLLFSALCGAIGGILGVNLKGGRTNKRKR